MKMENQDNYLTQILARIEKLESAVFGDKVKAKKSKNVAQKTEEVDYSLNIRAFVKRIAADKSGPKKFTIMLSYLAKGKIDKDIPISEIRKFWDKMKAQDLLGNYNRFYANEAKTQGWVDSKKYGVYCLTKEWENAL